MFDGLACAATYQRSDPMPSGIGFVMIVVEGLLDPLFGCETGGVYLPTCLPRLAFIFRKRGGGVGKRKSFACETWRFLNVDVAAECHKINDFGVARHLRTLFAGRCNCLRGAPGFSARQHPF